MTKKLNEAVNDILGIDNQSADKTFENESYESNIKISDFQEPAPVPKKVDESKPHVDQDYDTSRDNYYSLIEKGQQAIDGILDIAKEGQHPRAYEVAGQLIGQVAQVTDKLQDLQKKLKDLKELPKTANTNIKNALFVGSTHELQKMLRKETPEASAEKAKENEVIEGKAENE
tara:strand:- start:196 stop:714 length:519 start_codon:yes stop_codon:yes gene_type:complete